MAQQEKILDIKCWLDQKAALSLQSTLEILGIAGVILRVHDTSQSKQLYCIKTLKVLSFKNGLPFAYIP